jgi:hypothetical protein
MENLAILLPVKLDGIDTIYDNYKKLQQHWIDTNYKITYINSRRGVLQIEDFTDYFKNLINTIVDTIGFKYETLQIQWAHPGQYRVHKDIERKTNITIPLCPVIDPVAWYDDGAEPKVRQAAPSLPPNQISYYSDQHPMLLNVKKLHGVFCAVRSSNERALLQLSWDTVSFYDMINRNPDIWEMVTETGLKTS